MNRASSLHGCLLGGALGDALGLPAEGLSRRRVAARWHGEWTHRFCCGKGWLSDDTEHSLMIAAAMVRHPDEAKAFQRSFAAGLRWWLAALPAGVGLGTARAIGKLWCGWPPARAGVRSAGNGAAMRAAIIGVTWAGDAAKRRAFTEAASRVTHRDPRAVEAAHLVAEAAACAAAGVSTPDVLARLRPLVTSAEMIERWTTLEVALSKGTPVRDYAAAIGCGNAVSGFAPNTVAVALHGWLTHRGDFRAVLESVLSCGGDTDSVAAIAGGIAGAECEPDDFPKEWVDGLADWPRSRDYILKMATALATGAPEPPRLRWWAVPARNAAFLTIVLGHALRRAFPPY